MTDIVERLRDGNNPSPFATALEAADYIDRLRSEIAKQQTEISRIETLARRVIAGLSHD